ncbi:MAG TPA: hypothetical protein VMT03_26925 [Polyangia bacterium]|nr:hypothetical protein [Polyangia bacterium]
MRHLVAYFGNEPDNLSCALFSARGALYARSAPGVPPRPEGYGLGFVQGGDVLLQKRPRAETLEVDIYNLVKDTRAEALIGRVGFKHDGSTLAEDTDPFRFRSWLFGSIGELGEVPFEDLRERMLESTPAFLRRNIRGLSPSEHLFHVFLAFLHDAGILDQPSPAPAAVHGALRNSVGFVDKLLEGNGAGPLQVALAATNGRCFAAAGINHPLRYLAVEGISDCPVCHAKNDPGRNGRRIPHESLRALVIEADRDVPARAGWHDVPDRSALVAGPDGAPRILPL